MKPLMYLLGVYFLLIVGNLTAQNHYDKEIAQSKRSIDSIINAEKAMLKSKLIDIEKQLDNRAISASTAKQMKQKAVEEAHINIQLKTKQVASRLSVILRQKVDEKHALSPTDSIEKKKLNEEYNIVIQKVDSLKKEQEPHHNNGTRIDIGNNHIYIGEKVHISKGNKYGCDGEDLEFCYTKKYKRTQSGLNFAIGFHNLNSREHFSNDHFRLWGSKSVEIGYTRNTRLLNNTNLLHLTYGLSWMMDKLKMKGDEHFVKEGNITKIEPYPKETIRSKFKTIYLILPVNLEFDLTPPLIHKDKKYFPIHKQFRFGIGGYIGALLTTKQKVKYEEDGRVRKDKNRKYYNVNEWTYGLSAHIGYRGTVFYARYSLIPLFTNNPVNEYPFSIGIRLGR